MKIISNKAKGLVRNAVAPAQTCEAVEFLNRFLTVQVPHLPTRSHIKMHQYQENYVRALDAGGSIVCLHPRQTGVTMITLGYLLWTALHNSRKKILVVGVTKQQANSMASLVHEMLNAIPTVSRQAQLTRATRDTLAFNNASVMHFLANDQVGVHTIGSSFDMIYCDSFACIDDQVGTYSHLAPALRAGGTMIIGSTPVKAGDLFEAVCFGGVFQFHRIFIEDAPFFSPAWKQQMQTTIGYMTYSIEYDCVFV